VSTTRPLHELSADELAVFRKEQQAAYDTLKAGGLKLDLTRGKPSAEQLDLSNGLLDLPTTYQDAAGTDTRNYGGLYGLTGLRKIFADVLRVEPEQLIAGGNSSLTLMKDVLTDLLLFGAVDSTRPWIQEEKRRFICPVPGYDRHFLLTETLGFELVTVPMREDGPDADAIAQLVADDPTIKGMWMVPTYANPTGDVCSQEVAAKLASMPTAAPDFKILWDNAYAVHHLTPQETKSADILSLAAASGNPHRPVMFASTSKITFAGAGVAFLAASKEQVEWFVKYLGVGSIGPDKVNQLRHIEFFGDAEGVLAHMAKHREILAPKFAEVQRILSERLAGLGVATWTDPIGGYFVSVDVIPGTASRVVQLAKEAGIALTAAGAAFPHGNDPDDTNLRLAPSFPVLEEVTAAMEAVATCILLAAAEKLAG